MSSAISPETNGICPHTARAGQDPARRSACRSGPPRCPRPDARRHGAEDPPADGFTQPLYAARAIGHGNQHSKGAVAFHPQGNGIIRTFQHNAHHAGSRQQAAQRRACHRSGVVNLFHALYQRRAVPPQNTTPPSSDKARTMFFSSIAIFSCKSMERHYCLSDCSCVYCLTAVKSSAGNPRKGPKVSPSCSLFQLEAALFQGAAPAAANKCTRRNAPQTTHPFRRNECAHSNPRGPHPGHYRLSHWQQASGVRRFHYEETADVQDSKEESCNVEITGRCNTSRRMWSGAEVTSNGRCIKESSCKEQRQRFVLQF